jgi:hypothetical protein
VLSALNQTFTPPSTISALTRFKERYLSPPSQYLSFGTDQAAWDNCSSECANVYINPERLTAEPALDEVASRTGLVATGLVWVNRSGAVCGNRRKQAISSPESIN